MASPDTERRVTWMVTFPLTLFMRTYHRTRERRRRTNRSDLRWVLHRRWETDSDSANSMVSQSEGLYGLTLAVRPTEGWSSRTKRMLCDSALLLRLKQRGEFDSVVTQSTGTDEFHGSNLCDSSLLMDP